MLYVSKPKAKIIEIIRRNDFVFCFVRLILLKKSIRIALKRRALRFKDALLNAKSRGTSDLQEVAAEFNQVPKKKASEFKPNNGGGHKDVKFGKFLELYKLRNFATAAVLSDEIDFYKLRLRDKALIIQCYLSTNRGVSADILLDELVRHYINSEFKVDGALVLANLIYISGFSLLRKSELIRTIFSRVKNLHDVNGSIVNELALLKLKIDMELYPDVDPLNYVDLDDCGGVDFDSKCKFLPILKSYGYDEQVQIYLVDLYNKFGFENTNLLKYFLICYPEWFAGKNELIADLITKHKSNLSLLSVAAQQVSVCQDIDLFVDASLEFQSRNYPHKDIFSKCALLRVLLRIDKVDLVLQLIDGEKIFERALPVKIAKGYGYFLNDDFHSALACFLEVLIEDPADEVASAGIRLIYPRIGESYDSILELRKKIGYGLKGFGRVGIRYLGSELTSSLLLKGDYLRGQYTVRNSKNWLALKRYYRDRFLNCELIPQDSSDRTIFVIGDSGVGDEIRAAQFYPEIAKHFGKVIASCDPRLLNIFKNSFPSIIFIPVPRIRKGVSSRKDGDQKRIAGFDEKVSNYLTEECRHHIDESDYITYSQNLFFNHFAGTLHRPQAGPYLRVNSSRDLCVSSKFRVGILWRSHFRSGARKYLYLDIEELLPLSQIDGVELWSIQHSIDEREAEICRENNITLIDDVDLFNDFDGLAEYLTKMDLLIGISSVPIELGAALGVDVWMLGFSPENYYLRTAGGKNMEDRYTLNSTVIAPPWIDFSDSRRECVENVINEACRKLKAIIQQK